MTHMHTVSMKHVDRSLHNLPHLLAFIILTVSGGPQLMGQASLPVESRELIRTSLSTLGMRTSDVRMPPDSYDRDVHRMPIHDSIFTQPLSVLDVAHQYSDREDAPGGLMLAVRELDLIPPRWRDATLRPQPRTITVTAQRLTGSLQTIVERLVQVIDRLRRGTDTPRQQWWDTKPLAVMGDSLWMNEVDDTTESVFDNYLRQRRQRAQAELSFQQADTMLHTSFTDLYSYGCELYGMALGCLTELRGLTNKSLDSVATITIETEVGRIGIGGRGNDVYRGVYTLIIDVGGNDIYDYRASSKASFRDHPVQCILDLQGNDTYLGNEYAIGAAFAGVGVVIDDVGDDVYKAGDGSLGSSYFGVGILHDNAGNDIYIGGQNTQGCGIFGLGLLYDAQGHDTYRCHAQGQGFGGTRGLGMLRDDAGNDHYVASSPYVDVLRYESHFVTFAQGAALGYRPIASGGIGILSDRSGNDSYSSDIYGQGTGYWYALGALIDNDGEDRYQSYQYAQGAGVHLAAGVLHDLAGDDVYVSHGVSQGCGHDIAIGALFDDRGNDAYVTEGLSLGGGNANAVSILVDRTGDDAYSAHNQSNTLGYSDFRRSSGMLGLCIDGGGNDLYGDTKRNSTTTLKSTYGVFLDTNHVIDPRLPTPQQDFSATPLAQSFDSLFIQASAAPLRFQHNVAPARDRLAQMDLNVLPLLFQFARSGMPRERLTIEDVVPKLRQRDSVAVDQFLATQLTSEDLSVAGLAATITGKTRAPLLEQLRELTARSSWKIRRLAASTLGQIGDRSACDILLPMLQDQHPEVRSRAAYALGSLGQSLSTPAIIRVFDDEHRFAPYALVEGAARGPRRSFDEVEQVLRALQGKPTFVVALRLLNACEASDAAQRGLAGQYRSWDTEEQDAFRRVLPSLNPEWRMVLDAVSSK